MRQSPVPQDSGHLAPLAWRSLPGAFKSNPSSPREKSGEGPALTISYAILNHVRRTLWLFTLLALSLITRGLPASRAGAAQATIPASIFIQSPREGQALQGVEIIEGKIRGEGFQGGTVHFGYANPGRTDRTWFYIADLEPAAQDSSQTSFRIEWDTSQVTDGNYDIRIVAGYEGGAAIFELIPNLRIRNYSPVETPTPAPRQEGTQAGDTPTATDPPPPADTPTPLPPNPVVVQTGELYQALAISAAAVAGAFFLGMIYWYIRKRTS